jgi:hypothetical protein
MRPGDPKNPLKHGEYGTLRKFMRFYDGCTSKITYFIDLVIIETYESNRCGAASGLRDCSQGSLSWMNKKQMNKGEILLTKRQKNRSKSLRRLAFRRFPRQPELWNSGWGAVPEGRWKEIVLES